MVEPQNSSGSQIKIPKDTGRDTTFLPDVVLFALAGFIVPALLALGFALGNEMQVVAIGMAVLGVVLIMARPFWGLLFFVALLYARPEEVIPALAGMHFTLAISLVTLTGMVFKLCLDRSMLVRTPLIGMMLGFCCAMGLSGLVGGTTGAAIMDGGRLVMLVVLIVNLCRTPARYQALVTAIVALSCYLALYSTYLYFMGAAYIDQGLARSRGTGIFSDPNDLAATMIAGLALALTRVVQVRGVQRTLYGLCSAAMLLAIALTNSRGGLLALLAMVIGAVVTFSRNKPRAMAAALAVAGLLLVVAPGRMKNFDSKEESANSRFLFWKEGIIQLRAHPITGVGYLRFPDVNSGFVAHNSFVHCFAELGLPGFFFFMGTIFYAFKRPDSMASPRLRGKAAGIRAGKDGYEVIRESGAISQPPVPRDLIGARLAIMGYLAACFWITRTYTPVLYVFLSLPVAQQVAASGTAALNYGKLGDRMRNLGIIGGLCLALFVVVCLLVWKNS